MTRYECARCGQMLAACRCEVPVPVDADGKPARLSLKPWTREQVTQLLEKEALDLELRGAAVLDDHRDRMRRRRQD
jgi:hypothetical protein